MVSLEQINAKIKKLETANAVKRDMIKRDEEIRNAKAKLWSLEHPKMNKGRGYLIRGSQKLISATRGAIAKAKANNKVSRRKPRKRSNSNGIDFGSMLKYKPLRF